VTTGPKAKKALAALTARVIGGEFDATREESDAWAASPEGQETMKLLLRETMKLLLRKDR
jgi:hypothetical protein